MFPTRQSLGLMKSKLKGAETGHSLLKRKSEALTKYIHTFLNVICDLWLTYARRFRGMMGFAVRGHSHLFEQRSQNVSMRPNERWAE